MKHDLLPTDGAWQVATCLHGIPVSNRDGVAFHDAPLEIWDRALAEIEGVGFTLAELADSHVRPADLDRTRLHDLLALARSHHLRFPSVHVQRRSVIEPGRGSENLDYAHRTIDAAAAMGMTVFSTGLHQPFTLAQRQALWFWTEQGAKDPDDPDVWALAVSRLRELGRHAADVGLSMSLEMYEDTYLGTPDSAVRLVEEIGLENVGLNPDIGNLVRLRRPQQDWREMFAKTLPYANYWHLKNYSRDEASDASSIAVTPTSLEGGLINYRAVINEAIDIGYEGIFVMEQYGGDSLGVCATNREYVLGVLDVRARVDASASAGLPKGLSA
ncbi:sugar phosphate isomerase/epimerase family protein [Agromyces silvae]|uniref:sugar phosphate isomerase/epimerase family protein n=1 Tax=Agromyces silvae TaxID=3388266 RepID=UPI00280AB92B|nr:sugar phosphate isomerase/epimerase family protein [Agromyces protaetiae]